jgi:hypothetical protein
MKTLCRFVETDRPLRRHRLNRQNGTNVPPTENINT